MHRIDVDWSQRQGAAARAAEDACLRAQRLLAETDWYVIRQLETGKPVPVDVTRTRAAARRTLGGE